MGKLSVSKVSDYVPKEVQRRAERIKKVMEIEGYNYHGGRCDFAECIGMKPQNFSRCMNSGKVGDDTCRKIKKAFPTYALNWLLGYSDSMTTTEELFTTLSEADREAQLLHTGFFSFAQLAGFKIEVAPIDKQDDISDITQNIKSYCTIKHAEKEIVLSMSDLNDLENELCDYVEFRLLHMMKTSTKGGKNGKE